MARRVFFSFHYQRDVWRVNQIRKRFAFTTGDDPFHDASLWEEAAKKGDAAIKRMIDVALERTTVTCFLLGAKTAARKYVRYEYERSVKIGNGLLAVRIHRLRNKEKKTDDPGPGLFSWLDAYKTYDWVIDNGEEYIGTWIENAYKSSEKCDRDQKIRRRVSGNGWSLW